MTNQYPRNWHKYDLCLKCPLINDDISDEVVVFVNKLSKIIGGQYIYGFISEYDGRFTILLRAGSKFVLNKGIQESWELPLDPDICNIIAKNGNESYFIDPFTINHVPTISSIPPFHYIYAKYKTDPSIQHLYSCKLNGVSPFSKMMRVKMLMDLLKNNSMIDRSDAHVESRIDDRENNDVLLEFTISRLLYRGTVKDVFAIHDFSELALLRDRIYPIRWLTSLPFDLIRDYFGESIAFDVAFFEYLFFCMYIIAIVGVAIQFLTIFYNDFYSIPELPPFAFFIPFYFIFAIQRWKRQEQIFAMKWNTRKQLEPINLERLNHNNYVRNDFQGKLLYSPVNGEVIIYYSHSMKTFCRFFLGRLLSILILTLCIIGTLISYAGIYYARYKLRQINSISFYVQYIASGGNAFISILYNQIFGFIAYQITGLENHRTDENYEFSYTVKMILFQLVSTLASFYYLAFAAAYVQKHGETVSSVGECGYDNCMFPVSINAMVFVFMEGLWRLFTQFLIPYFRIQLSAMLHRRRYRFVREKEREIVDLESSAVNGMKPIVKKLIVPDSPVQENDPNHNDYRDISEDFQHLNDQFEQVNPVKPDQLKHVMEVIRLQSPTTQSRNDDWIDQLKPKAPESVDQENIDIDLNEDIFPPSRENVDRFTRVKFFDSGDDESQSEQHNLHNSELEQNSTLEMPKSPRLEISTASEKNQGDGFSSAGELTPPPSPLASQYRSPKSHRKSNLNAFYHEFPLSNDDDNFIQSSEIESKDESSENGRILRDQDVHVSHQDFHRVEYDAESDEEDEEQSRFYSKRAPFERFSSVSYQAQFHHLNNHLFVFRLMTIALCFGAALPGIFGLMLIIFFVDLRVQLWQLMDFYPRNLPLVTSSIGWVWIIAYDALLIASAGTNASLIIFTIESSGYSHWQLIHRMLLWIGIVFFLLILQLFTSFIFQRIPKEVKIQNRRSHIIVRKLIDRIPDRLDSLPMEML